MKKVTVTLIAIIFIFCPLITAHSADWTLSTNVGDTRIMGFGAVDSTHVRAAGSRGEIYLYDGASWSFETDLGGGYRGAFALDSTHFWAAGENAAGKAWVCFHNGSSWSENTFNTLFAYDVYAADATNVWTVCDSGNIYFSSDGVNWALKTDTGGTAWRAVDGSASNNVWAVGDRQVLSFDGTDWKMETEFTTAEVEKLRGVAVIAPNDVWVAGSSTGVIWHYDGNWNRSTDLGKTLNYSPITAQGANQIWTGGDQEADNIYFFNGSLPWTVQYDAGIVAIISLDASVSQEVWAGGAYGRIWHLDIPSPSPIPTATTTPTPDGYKTPTPSPSATPTPTVTPTPSPSPSPPPTQIPTPSTSPTPTPLAIDVPFVENFDGVWTGGVPRRWSKEFISNTVDWVKFSGGYDENPPAHDKYNALFYYDDGGEITRLITPPLDFGHRTSNTQLRFWHAQSDWSDDQDELTVYYRISDDADWVELAYYPDNIPTWTLQTLELPSPSNRYSICFQGQSNYGYGICIDDVVVIGEFPPLPTATPTPSLTPTPSVAPTIPLPTPYSPLPIIDFNGDGTGDIAIFRGSSGLWAVRGLTRIYFGGSTDEIVPGDYDGDGTTDIGIFRESSGLWAIRGITRIYFGASFDQPVQGDYNGSGTAAPGIFRKTSGLWAIRGITRTYFGSFSDYPVPGYYDANDIEEIGIFRRSSGLWAIRGITRVYFGSIADQTVPGNYTGDRIWTPGIFRPASGLWAIRGTTRVYFGGSPDLTVPGDYIGDGTDEIGIFRETSGLWAIRGITRVYYGSSGDIPVVRQKKQ